MCGTNTINFTQWVRNATRHALNMTLYVFLMAGTVLMSACSQEASDSTNDDRVQESSTADMESSTADMKSSTDTNSSAARSQPASSQQPSDNEDSSPNLNADPIVDPGSATQIAEGITVIPDPRIAFVPNIGIIEGEDAILVVDTGMGPQNGERVLSLAKDMAGDRQIYLTTTHFHPEHNFGASAFEGDATIILNELQAAELEDKGPSYIELFKTFGDHVAAELEGTRLVDGDQIYAGKRELDLGGRTVVFEEIPAHTRGDQLIYIPDEKVIFTGDIVEARFFPIMPDADSDGSGWIEVLEQLEALEPDIVVPGHGATGGVELIQRLRVHLMFVRDRVDELVAKGYDQDAITELLVPSIEALYPGWDNGMFLPFEIAIFYAEATGNPPQLPGFD